MRFNLPNITETLIPHSHWPVKAATFEPTTKPRPLKIQTALESIVRVYNNGIKQSTDVRNLHILTLIQQMNLGSFPVMNKCSQNLLILQSGTPMPMKATEVNQIRRTEGGYENSWLSELHCFLPPKRNSKIEDHQHPTSVAATEHIGNHSWCDGYG